MTTAIAPSTEEVVPVANEQVDADEAAFDAEVARREAARAAPAEVVDDDPPDVTDTPKTPEPQPSAGVSVSEAPNAEEAKPVEPAKPPSLDDLLAKISEADRPAFQSVIDAEKKERERIAAEKAELDHKFRSAQGRIAALEKKGAAPAAQQPAKKAPDAQEVARRQAFKEDYPEVAERYEALEKRIEDLAAQNIVVPPEVLEFMAEQRAKAISDQRISAVVAVHKDFVPIVTSPDFDQWASKQSPFVQSLIASDEPEKTITAVDLFKAANPQFRSSPSPSASADAGNSVTDTPEQAALRKKREAQLRAVELPANGGTLPQQLDADDDDALFDHLAKKADARLAAQRR